MEGSSRKPASARSVFASTEIRSPCSEICVSRISSALRSSSASIISSRKKGFPPTFGRRSAQTCLAPSRTPKRVLTRRTCSSGERPRSSIRVKPSRSWMTRSSGRVTTTTKIGNGSLPWTISPRTSRLALSPQCDPSTTSTRGWARAMAARRFRTPATMVFLRPWASSSSARDASRLVASSARRATIGLDASPPAAPPPARAMRPATWANGSSPVVPIAARTSSAMAA